MFAINVCPYTFHASFLFGILNTLRNTAMTKLSGGGDISLETYLLFIMQKENHPSAVPCYSAYWGYIVKVLLNAIWNADKECNSMF